MTFFVVFIAVFCFFAFCFYLGSKESKKQSKQGNTTPIVVNVKTSGQDNLNERLHCREKRLRRHRRITSILSLMVKYNELMNGQNFYDFKNGLIQYNEIKGSLRKEHILDSDIETAIRFCHMENFYGTCHHELTAQEVEMVRNWRDIQVNEEKLLEATLQSYKHYWNGVLDAYKRQSARKNRLNYLIDDLEEISMSQELQEYPDIIDKIKALQSEYTRMLEGYNQRQ